MLSPVKTIFVPHLGGIDVGYEQSETVLNKLKPTVILFHPFTTTSEYYRKEFEDKALTDAMNFLAIELLGHGETRAQKTDSFTYWDSAIMALQVLEALGIERAYVLGTSQGGWTAARMALLAPEKIQGIFLIGSSMDDESPKSRELGCWDGPASCAGLVTMHGDLSPTHDFAIGDSYIDFLMEIGIGKHIDPARREFWGKIVKHNYHGLEGKKRLTMAAVNLATRDGLRYRVSHITCPVLWLQGTDDVVYSFKNAEEGIKLFTQSVEAKLVRVEGGVHFLGWIHPQVVAQELLNFVNPRSRGGSASP